MKRRYLDARYDVTGLNDAEVDVLCGEVTAMAEASDRGDGDDHPDVRVQLDLTTIEVCSGCGVEVPEGDDVCGSCEQQRREDAQLRNFVANVLGDDLIDGDLPVEVARAFPYGIGKPRRVGDEGVLVLYGDREGVTLVVAATDEDDAERRIIATFSDAVHVDCVEESVDQRPLSIRLTAGLIPPEKEETARRLLELDAGDGLL